MMLGRRYQAMVTAASGSSSPIWLAGPDSALSRPPAAAGSGLTPQQARSARIKAAFDTVASAILLVLALPMLVLIAVLVKLDTPGPVLFRQQREGLWGKPFNLVKFRTMHHCAERDQSVQATADDRRVTPVGLWLRRVSLDELPQLWNVLRGDMSLVGPRPHYATTRAGRRLFSEVVPQYGSRLRVKPGITGWAQVQGFRGEVRTEQELLDRVAHDNHYIENWSFRLDLLIIWRTLLCEVFVSRSGRAY